MRRTWLAGVFATSTLILTIIIGCAQNDIQPESFSGTVAVASAHPLWPQMPVLKFWPKAVMPLMQPSQSQPAWGLSSHTVQALAEGASGFCTMQTRNNTVLSMPARRLLSLFTGITIWMKPETSTETKR